MLHTVLPPICEARHRALALAAVPSRPRTGSAASLISATFRDSRRRRAAEGPMPTSSGISSGSSKGPSRIISRFFRRASRKMQEGVFSPLRLATRLRRQRSSNNHSRSISSAEEQSANAGAAPAPSFLRTVLPAALTQLSVLLTGGWPHYRLFMLTRGAIHSLIEGRDLTRVISTVQLRQCSPPAALRGWSCEPDDAGGTTCTFDARAFEQSISPQEQHSLRSDSEGAGGSSFAWRWLFPLDADVLVLSVSVLLLNMLIGSWLLREVGHAYGRPAVYTSVARRIGRFMASFQPTEVLLLGVEDLVHCVLQIGCAAYAGRVILARFGLLAHEVSPLDFGSGAGLALHLGIGLLTWGTWEAVCEAGQAVQDDFARWRWSTQALRLR